MTHVQIDDDFFDHPKVLSVGKDAKILSLAAICYSGNMLTDGFIPSGAVLVLAAKTGVRNTKPAIDELIAARLWETTEGGYLVHDYLEYNASAEKVRAKQAAARERMQRLRSPDVRANNEGTSREVRDTTTTTTSSIEPNGSQELEDVQDEPKADADPPQPYDLLETLCDVIGSDPSVLSKRDKNLQLAVAKRLIEDGLTVRELRDVVAWLQRQTWVTSGIDFFLVEKQIGKWRMNGRQSAPPGPVAVPPLPDGVTWDLVREWRMRKEQGRFLPDEHSRLLDQLDGKDQAA